MRASFPGRPSRRWSVTRDERPREGSGRMQVRFWGVRGSVPWATPAAIGHGCNTPCIEVSDDRTGSTIVLDAGSGIVGLGGAIAGAPRELPILLTHYHWD